MKPFAEWWDGFKWVDVRTQSTFVELAIPLDGTASVWIRRDSPSYHACVCYMHAGYEAPERDDDGDLIYFVCVFRGDAQEGYEFAQMCKHMLEGEVQ